MKIGGNALRISSPSFTVALRSRAIHFSSLQLHCCVGSLRWSVTISGQDFSNNTTFVLRSYLFVQSVLFEKQAQIVQPQQIQDCRVPVSHTYRLFSSLVTDL